MERQCYTITSGRIQVRYWPVAGDRLGWMSDCRADMAVVMLVFR